MENILDDEFVPEEEEEDEEDEEEEEEDEESDDEDVDQRDGVLEGGVVEPFVAGKPRRIAKDADIVRTRTAWDPIMIV